MSVALALVNGVPTQQTISGGSGGGASIVAAYSIASAAGSVTASTPINFDNKLIDTNNAVTTGTGTWKFTAPVAGYYELSVSAVSGGAVEIIAYKNGSGYAYMCTPTGGGNQSGVVIISLNSGDYIDFRPTGTTTFFGADGNGVWQAICGVELIATTALSKAPTRQIFTSGSGTYTLPTGPSPIYIVVTMIGAGGGGGGGSASGAGNGGTGGDSTFGSFTAAGGGGGLAGTGSNTSGGGGTPNSNSGSPDYSILGGAGQTGLYSTTSSGTTVGGMGGDGFFGGAGTPGNSAGGNDAQVNSGGGGGGAGGNTALFFPAGGGASGSYLRATIASPSSSYSYAVGAAGSAGAAGSGFPGGAGGSGIIIVDEYYANGTNSIARQVVVGTAQTADSTLSANSSFNAFSTSPTVSFTATITGTYRIWGVATFYANNGTMHTQIAATSGSPTFLAQPDIVQDSISNTRASIYSYCIVSLTAGNAYTFTLEAASPGANITLNNSTSSTGTYLIAEQLS